MIFLVLLGLVLNFLTELFNYLSISNIQSGVQFVNYFFVIAYKRIYG